MQTTGYLASLFIGISLGMMGGGGSILTVPVLVYLFGISPLSATSYSLFVVGATSLVGAVNGIANRLVRFDIAFVFGLASITTVFVTRKWVLPLVPEHLFHVGRFPITHSVLTMVLFAVLMVMAAVAMIQNESHAAEETREQRSRIPVFKLVSFAIAAGLATGFLGAGGGFLLIPVLVLLVKMPMKKAVGTSLLIIALNSLIGFYGDLENFNIDWIFLFRITAIAVTGILIGGMINKKVNGQKLKKIFGWFVLVMGITVLIRELFFQY